MDRKLNASEYSRFPPGLENLQDGDPFPGREEAENFDQTGKVREFYAKYLINQEFLTLENGINIGKVRGNLAVRKVKTMEIGYLTLN